LKLVLVSTGLGLGGAETLVVELALAAQSRGDSVDVVSMIEPGVLAERLGQAGIAVHSLGFQRGRPTVGGTLRYLRLLRRLQPDVVHSHMLHANLLTRLSRLFVAQRALVNSVHNVNERGDAAGRSARLRSEIVRRTDWLSDLTSHVSRIGAASYVSRKLAAEGRMLYVANGVSTARYGGEQDSSPGLQRANEQPEGRPFQWICVASLLPQKNHMGLLKAFAEVVASDSDQHLQLVGAGALEAELRSLVTQLKLDAHVTFLGQRTDVPELLRAADGFVLASDFEGLPLVVLEAQAARLPVVVTAVGAVPDVVLDTTSGYLVESGSVVALAEAMRRLLALSTEGRQAFGRAGRRNVIDHFSVEAYTTRWNEIYQLTSTDRSRRKGSMGANIVRDADRSVSKRSEGSVSA
jgi:glycosyltransferase involved in cell wall biosynthesis